MEIQNAIADEKIHIVVQDWQMLLLILVIFSVGFLVGKFEFNAKKAGK